MTRVFLAPVYMYLRLFSGCFPTEFSDAHELTGSVQNAAQLNSYPSDSTSSSSTLPPTRRSSADATCFPGAEQPPTTRALPSDAPRKSAGALRGSRSSTDKSRNPSRPLESSTERRHPSSLASEQPPTTTIRSIR